MSDIALLILIFALGAVFGAWLLMWCQVWLFEHLEIVVGPDRAKIKRKQRALFKKDKQSDASTRRGRIDEVEEPNRQA